ncbi:MAG: hypothetical protein E6Q50_10800 [Lysobacter sp.]|nr:MAG: hypothetical protein E6Q50_10800 [Lysobacter sp.]
MRRIWGLVLFAAAFASADASAQTTSRISPSAPSQAAPSMPESTTASESIDPLPMPAPVEAPSADADPAPSAGAPASTDTTASVPPELAVASATDAATAADFDFLSWYSDGYYNEYYRFKAAREASKGDWAHAARLFEIAARYGDKYSQHRLSLIRWHGVGAPKDRIEGYIWADLAAERGYPPLLAIREKMWEALTLEERAAVPVRGKPRYAKYGDAAAMPLFRGMLARQRARHFLLIRSTVPSKLPRFYPDSYMAQEARSWKKIRVDIGDIQRDDATASSPAPEKGAAPDPPPAAEKATPR